VTQFQDPARYNVIGLLAHNYLSGKTFARLAPGLEVFIVYGDGTSHQYQVTGISEYQKLDPFSLDSYYRDLADDEQLSTVQVFNRVYTGAHHVTFQTCMTRDGNPEWGLRFVIAEPYQPLENLVLVGK
jgi:hypothetical protein